ncbi:MAG: hypothetical protein Q8N99_01090 [Nanoarchaeota archaeon]|nr:hypothetical protein [Nanoarchaeota archaeon]
MNKSNICINCFSKIENPVCIDCYLEQINFWLRDSDISKEHKKVIMCEIKKRNNNEIKDSLRENARCIICHREKPTLCSYCFFLKIDNTMRVLNETKKISGNFLDVFNYRTSIAC